jgi:hypothetical protein
MVLQKLDTGELLPPTIVTKVAYATQGRNHLQQNAKVYEDVHVRPTSCWIISLISTAANKASTYMTLTWCALCEPHAIAPRTSSCQLQAN